MLPIAEEIIIRSIQKIASPEEQAILNKWLREGKENVAYYCQLEEIWNSRKKIPEEAVENAWQILTGEIAARPQKERRIVPVKKRKIVWLRYAAAVFIGVLLASSVWMIFSDISKESQQHILVQNVVYNKTGVQSVVLPDNSEVWINEDTRITYPERFPKGKRVVSLEGKAYFDIRKDPETPFIVQIGSAEIEVTGTEFFVESTQIQKGKSVVTLISGTVNLHYKDIEGKELSAPLVSGEQACINQINGSLEIENVDTHYYMAWKDGTYRFTDEPLERIVPLLAKRFDLDIQIPESLRNKRFTGRVIPGENVEDVLKSIGKSYPIKYRISGRNVYVDEK
ncbi:FecR domain-containing protein [Proteiniphilum sp.]|uniref:FecR family protein n=1 Tax=Proteiniphilum sp. TaxID=1926877 RepID=UPI00332CEF00